MNIATIISKPLKSHLRTVRSRFKNYSSVKVWPIQILFTFSSRWCLQSSFLNSVGFQKFRVLSAEKIWQLRRKLFSKGRLKLSLESANVLRKLDSEGVVKFDNVLPHYVFERAKKLAGAIERGTIANKQFTKAGAEYREVVVAQADPELNSYLVSNFWVNDIANQFLAKTNLRPVWRIKLVRDSEGGFDQNTLFHSDTYFATLKAFIYLDKVYKEDDVLEYLIGSNLMTKEILDLHDTYARLKNDSPWPSRAEIESLQFNSFLQDIEENTLLLADTRGINRRKPKDKTSPKWRATFFL